MNRYSFIALVVLFAGLWLLDNEPDLTDQTPSNLKERCLALHGGTDRAKDCDTETGRARLTDIDLKGIDNANN